MSEPPPDPPPDPPLDAPPDPTLDPDVQAAHDASRDHGSGASAASHPNAQAYWRANLRLVASLLAVWAFVSFGLSILFVEDLNRAHFAGFPLGFWFAHQGSIYVFVVLIWVYARMSDRLAKRYGVD